MNLKAPFPWFGGKSRAASLIWSRFGNVLNYVEPFAGSLAVLLNRANYDQLEHTETVNDLDCYLSNFWRALSLDPAAVAQYADHPVNEADLHARHLWLVNRDEFRERMLTDPDYYDPKIAGWWVWGLCQWIGSGWCKLSDSDPLDIADVDLGNNGRGVHRKLPQLGDNGRGVHRKRPQLGNNGRGDEPYGSLITAEQGGCASSASSIGGQRYGCASQASDSLRVYFEALANRLRRVRVCCGDWTRVLVSSPTEKIGVTGIVLDPPYARDLRNAELYSCETNVSQQVREWAIANGDNSKLRIALCGYSDEHAMPDGWECVGWKAGGGFDGQKRDRSNQNRAKETIWFSPHCLKPRTSQQIDLFAEMGLLNARASP